MSETHRKEELLACTVDELKSETKKRLLLGNRDIFLVTVSGHIYALDSFCYHAGGPLYSGDIEELGGRQCIRCPWHQYNVCLDSGRNFYKSIDPHNLKKPGVWTAGEVRQRTHTVTVKDGNIYVKLSPLDKKLDSDHYNKEVDL